MTSIHSQDPQAQQSANVSILKDGPERVRQRLDELRKHHNQSTEIYNKTQPLINEQIHQETLKYLKSGQVNGTKAKSQKPRAPKRQRNPPNANGIVNNNTITLPQTPANQRTSPLISSPTATTNGIHHHQQLQPPQLHTNGLQVAGSCLQTQPDHSQQNMHTSYQPMTHQQSMHIQPSQPQQSLFKYQTNNDVYQQPHTTMQQQQQQHVYHSQQAQQRVYPSQSQPNMQPVMQTNSLIHPQQHPQHQQQHPQHPQQTPQQQQLDQTQFIVHHQRQAQQPHHFAQHQSQIQHQQHPRLLNNQTQMSHHHHHHHAPFMSLPNDLDLTLQAGLECDVDSLIKHEMSVEGQLDFNHDLLLKLDNHYPIQHHQYLNHINHHT